MTSQVEEIKRCLATLLPFGECVLTFDQSLLDELPDIIRERFGNINESAIERLPALRRLFNLLLPDRSDAWNISSLPKLLEAAGISKTDYAPRVSNAMMQESEKTFSHWSLNTATENVSAVLNLQRDLGMGRYNDLSRQHAARWEHGSTSLRQYMRGVTTVPPGLIERATRRSYWELWITWWKLRGWLDANTPSLSIGPRWVTEIDFFREILGLTGHIGLDLFSNDESLVKVGDMHHMPFPDRYFQLVFIKNTVDKSYQVRQLVAELIRVTRPGGIVIVDQICGYGECSPLTRTDIQKSENLLRLFCSRGPIKVLVQSDIDLTKAKGAIIRDRARNNARLAVRLPY
jgi:hypothetical protein